MDRICYIVGAGENYGLPFLPREEDLVIAADAGCLALQQAGIRHDLIIGDFDSLGTIPQEKQVVTLPTVKDVTDTWAAIRLGEERGYREFRLYGCTGGRFDHTVANLQTVADVTARGEICRLYDKNQMIFGISGGATVHFRPEKRGFLSVFSHTDRCSGVTLRGLKYELENAELRNCFPLGVSNEFLGIPSSITIGAGIAIIVVEN